MLLTSPAYLAFLACVYFAFWYTQRRGPLPLLLIVAANYAFYAPWGWIYVAAVPPRPTGCRGRCSSRPACC
jgi:hypothetical protein